MLLQLFDIFFVKNYLQKFSISDTNNNIKGNTLNYVGLLVWISLWLVVVIIEGF